MCMTCCGGGAGVCGYTLCMTSLSLIGGACNHCLVRLVFAASIVSVFPYMCGNCCPPECVGIVCLCAIGIHISEGQLLCVYYVVKQEMIN